MPEKRRATDEIANDGPCIRPGKRRDVARQSRPKLDRHEYTVGWICAIATEYVAAQTMLDETHERPENLPPHDASHYTLGKIGPHNVVMTVLSEYGISPATAVARDMLHSFSNISVGLMVGIGGGAPTRKNDIRLGDIVVSTTQNGRSSVVQYDFGKAIQGQKFQQTGSLDQPPRRLRVAIVGLQARYKRYGHHIEDTITSILDNNPNLKSDYARPILGSDKLYKSHVVHPTKSEGACAAVCGCDPSILVGRPARAGDKLTVHYGVIASANQVMKDALIRDRIAADNDVLCFEMEAAGLCNHFPCLAIRGICDYSDSHKNKEWQGYAAMAAAVYAKDLLFELSPLRPPLPAGASAEFQNSGVEAESQQLFEKRRRELLESLMFSQIDARQSNIKKEHAKTCSWVLKSPEYLNWLDHAKRDQHHGFLWIKGKPGAGKSTLMKFVSANYQNKVQKGTLITFFFNARGGELEKSTLGMYRSLLFQLIDRLPQLKTILDSPVLLKPRAGSHEWTIESLKELFEEAVLHLEDEFVTCFIDALDECDEDEIRNMVSFFENISKATTSTNISFQVCFSSRHYPHITISKAVSLILEGQEGHRDDIANYVSSKLKIESSNLAQKVRDDLQEKASGIFMWVVLVVDILNKEFDRGHVRQLQQRLKEIPTDLDALFRDILTRDSRHKDQLLLCIQWVLFAKTPLSPQELYFAMLSVSGSENDETEGSSEWDPEVDTVDSMKRFILDSSKGLAEVTKSKIPTVQFIHESVRDFLLKHDGLSQIWSEFGNNFQGQCHERLKHCCLNYVAIAAAMRIGNSLPQVSPKEVDELRNEAENRLPFLRYATQQVLYHSDAAEGAGVSQVDFLQNFDLDSWIVLDNLFEIHKFRRHTSQASLLYILAEQNRANLIKTEPSKLECFKVEGERYGAPILAALVTESSEAVHAFLTAHKDANPSSSALRDLELHHYTQTAKPKTPVGEYYDSAHRSMFLYKILAVLLGVGETGADTKDERLRAPLSYATERRYLTTFKFLIETGKVSIDQKDKDGMTPTWHAYKGQCYDVMKLLLDTYRVDLENRYENGLTILLHASGQGNDAVIKLLLEHGRVDCESKDQYGRNSLSIASQLNYHTIIKLLLETGKADINARDDSGRTPLSYAASSSSAESIVLLLETREVEVDSRDNSGRTPLSYAASSSSAEIIKLLLGTSEVEVDSRDNTGRTPLSYAAERNDSHAVAVLLDTNQADPSVKDYGGWTPFVYTWEDGSSFRIMTEFLRRR